jgi:hypothetical protein
MDIALSIALVQIGRPNASAWRKLQPVNCAGHPVGKLRSSLIAAQTQVLLPYLNPHQMDEAVVQHLIRRGLVDSGCNLSVL